MASALAARFKNIKPAHVWNWAHNKNHLPAEYCPTIERLTKGVITCEQLRGDVEWDYLRMLTEKEG